MSDPYFQQLFAERIGGDWLVQLYCPSCDWSGEALLDQAELLLSSGGPEAVSVRNVAQAAGTTTRAVYTVFGSKDHRRPQSARGDVLPSANLGLDPLYLHNVRQLSCHILRHDLGANELAIAAQR
jgi:AcrR family transcriptional regulator